MARSTYIYIVFREDRVIGAFTVKHEMESFIKKLGFAVNVTRYRDGKPEAAAYLTVSP